MPKVNLTKSVSKSADVVIVGLTEAESGTALVGVEDAVNAAYTKRWGADVATLADALKASAKLEAITVLPAAEFTTLVVGLGDADVTPDAVRSATGAALRHVQGMKDVEGLTVDVAIELADAELVQAAAEGALLGAYTMQKYSATQKPAAVQTINIVTTGDAKALKPALEVGITVAASVRQARDWVNEPGNMLYPETFAEAAKAFLKDEKISVEILDEKALEKGGYGGILAVGGGSSHAPRLVRMSYAPRGATFHLGLVGKGITYDTGGLDIKPAGQMADMKGDMAGAAAVIGAMKAIAALGLRVKVTAYAAMAENMPSGTAYRSADVLTMFDGQTVENYNTDAEGRLVMADALAKVSTEEPDLVVDIATLTGACMVALGTRMAGLMASDDATADKLLDAAETAGEEFWHLPITQHQRDALESSIADMRSGGKGRWGGALVAGAFLHRFVPEPIAWAHLDIAGPADNSEAPFGCTPKGGTGVGVRTLVALATQLAG